MRRRRDCGAADPQPLPAVQAALPCEVPAEGSSRGGVAPAPPLPLVSPPVSMVLRLRRRPTGPARPSEVPAACGGGGAAGPPPPLAAQPNEVTARGRRRRGCWSCVGVALQCSLSRDD